MYCRNCGSEMNDIQAICLKCGVEKNKGTAFCPNCGKEVTDEAAVCLNCGVSLKVDTKPENDPNYLNGQDKTTMALVCFFLGGLGIHNFIMKENKKGVTRIITSFLCGIGGILALIDFVKILMGTYVVDPEKLI